MPPQEPKDPQPPPDKPEKPLKSLEQIVEEVGLYPIEAYEFIHSGLAYTVQKIHGELKDPQKLKKEEKKSYHVTGRDLSHGLREFALLRWGMLARTVLKRWNITRTEDFGRIVFALVANGHMSKTDTDTIDDFKNVFDFAIAFDENYRIPSIS
ncbi:MAG TPA: Minf_1886 family protein [Tepidisphaeraceae bacterium]|jgi:uncharacterized repeat protein (TIGR04138 family)|nr:Minf_1886 family protein [Tepidisphaeraceae bacterium]